MSVLRGDCHIAALDADRLRARPHASCAATLGLEPPTGGYLAPRSSRSLIDRAQSSGPNGARRPDRVRPTPATPAHIAWYRPGTLGAHPDPVRSALRVRSRRR